ncbi:serine-rich adhesin for platelets-like isoform X2 [Ptychodera flava]|uniref:serine-rich adhesin for platelets-like isoform X2 n=1 Tax=Ptychodera flava TaxID=63121 RepID=UPI00396A0146
MNCIKTVVFLLICATRFPSNCLATSSDSSLSDSGSSIVDSSLPSSLVLGSSDSGSMLNSESGLSVSFDQSSFGSQSSQMGSADSSLMISLNSEASLPSSFDQSSFGSQGSQMGDSSLIISLDSQSMGSMGSMPSYDSESMPSNLLSQSDDISILSDVSQSDLSIGSDLSHGDSHESSFGSIDLSSAGQLGSSDMMSESDGSINVQQYASSDMQSGSHDSDSHSMSDTLSDGLSSVSQASEHLGSDSGYSSDSANSDDQGSDSGPQSDSAGSDTQSESDSLSLESESSDASFGAQQISASESESVSPDSQSESDDQSSQSQMSDASSDASSDGLQSSASESESVSSDTQSESDDQSSQSQMSDASSDASSDGLQSSASESESVSSDTQSESDDQSSQSQMSDASSDASSDGLQSSASESESVSSDTQSESDSQTSESGSESSDASSDGLQSSASESESVSSDTQSESDDQSSQSQMSDASSDASSDGLQSSASESESVSSDTQSESDSQTSESGSESSDASSDGLQSSASESESVSSDTQSESDSQTSESGSESSDASSADQVSDSDDSASVSADASVNVNQVDSSASDTSQQEEESSVIISVVSSSVILSESDDQSADSLIISISDESSDLSVGSSSQVESVSSKSSQVSQGGESLSSSIESSLVLVSGSSDSDSQLQSSYSVLSSSLLESSDVSSSVVEVCLGITDCAGVCNGAASTDCAGVCNGNATEDCAGICNGGAYINNCDECVGGTTGRSGDFGKDKCGLCKAASDYRITWDCYGTCNGTAFVDDCGECVGGASGRANDTNSRRLDCRDICDGGWIRDDCGYCEPSDGSNSTASKYMDCSGTCVLPGFDRAYENECEVCVGGNTNLTDDAGKNDCGCNGVVSATSCLGCDGVANSGKTYDTCGVCGGNGTDCVGVGWVTPNFIPVGQRVTLTLIGAGFTSGSTLTCEFEATDGTKYNSSMIDYLGTTSLTCMSPALPAGNYTVTIQRDSDQPSNIGTSLYTYEDANVTAVTPLETDLDTSVSSITVTVTATAGAFSEIRNLSYAVPTLMLSGSVFTGGSASFTGQFTSDEEMEFDVSMPTVSCRITAVPSVNGYTALGSADDNPFEITVYAVAPSMDSAQFSNNGAEMSVTFDSGVEYSSFSSCSDIFDTASSALLGSGAECFFRDPKTLVIVIGKASQGSLVEPADWLALKTGAVKAFQEDYSRESVSNVTVAGPAQPLEPVALLDGSPKIPSCGDVKISGRRSTGSGARAMTYTWDVESDGDTTNVTNAISGLNGPNLEVDGELIDADTPYNFSLTVTNFLGESDTAYYVVERSALALPEVKIVAKGVDVSSASVSDSFDLTAEVTFYSECVPPGSTEFTWSVDNSEVPLNLKTMYKRTLYVDANSLPGDEDITFTVQVYKSSDPSKVATASIQVTTVSTPLVATIRGSAEMTVGRDSGNLEIDGSSSSDPDNVAVDMTYTWTCTQVTDNSACYSYKTGEEGQLFPATTDSAILVFDAMSMGADKTYEFTLTISKLTRVASASVQISAVSGNPPQVSVELENGDDNKVTQDQTVAIKALVKHTSPLVSVVFESVDTDSGYGYFDFSDNNGLVTAPKILASPDGTRSVVNVIIRSGQLVKGTSYKVQVTATDQDGQSSVSKVTFSVRAGVTSCDFTVADGASSYTEMEEINYLLENCVADEDAYPLSYQIFRVKDDNDNVEAISKKGSEPASSGIGKAARAGSSNNTFVAKVCDKYSCSEFTADIGVDAKLSFSSSEVTDFRTNQIEPLEFQGAYLEALVNTNLLFDKTSSSRRRKRSYAETTSTDEQERLTLIENVLSSSVPSEDDARLLIDQISKFVTSDLSIEDQDGFLDVMDEVIQIYSTDSDAIIDSESSSIVLEKLQAIGSGLDAQYNSAMLDKSRTATDNMIKSLLRGQSLGGGATQIASTGMTISIEKNVLDSSFSSAGGAVIDFGSELQNTYTAAWTCDSGTCSGVSVKTQHYDTGVDYRSTTDEDKNSRATDIVSVELADPDSDATLNVTGLTTPIKMNLTINSPDTSKFYTCKYWDEDTSAWSTSGVTTVEIDSSTVECQMNHLSEFGAFSSDIPSTVGPTTAAAVTGAATGSATTVAQTTDDVVIATAPSDGLSDGAIAGIAVGSAVFVAIVVILVVVGVKMAKKPSKVTNDVEDGTPNPALEPEEQVEMLPPPGNNNAAKEDTAAADDGATADAPSRPLTSSHAGGTTPVDRPDTEVTLVSEGDSAPQSRPRSSTSATLSTHHV